MEEIAGFSVDTRKLLGRGGFGEVFIALDRKTTRVAAKRVWLKTTSFKEILSEVTTLKNIKPHKNILKFITSERSKDFLWIFTEYCDEGDLSQYCTTHELEFTHKVEIAYQSACAINHLHSLTPSIVHRDIKPNNILMTHTKTGMEVKLADFGLAKTSSFMGKTLAMRTICGTEAYMAPEHFFMERRVAFTYGRSVDLYAFGLVLAGLLDAIPGQPLLPIQVRGLPIGLIMYKMQEQGLPVWSPVTLDIDEHPLVLELKAIISAMINFSPECRPTAEKAMHKLKHILSASPKADPLPKSLEGGKDMEEYFYNELTKGNETVIHKEEENTVIRKPDNGAEIHEPANGAGRYEPANGAGRHEPANGAGRHEPANGAGRHEPENGAGRHEPANGAGRHEPANGAGAHRDAERRDEPHFKKRAGLLPIAEDGSIIQRPAARKRQDFKSKTRGQNIRATMDLGARMRLRGPQHKFVIVGGSTGYNTSDVLWELDTPDDGFFWKCFDEIPEQIRGQHGHSVCSIDEHSFAIAGGSNSSRCESVCYMYSVKSKWQKLPNASIARCSAGLVCLNKCLYFVGGEGNRKAILKACEKLDLKIVGQRRRWSKCQDMLTEMVFPLAAAAGDGIHVVSNTHRNNRVRPGFPLQLQCFDTKTETWVNREPLPSRVRDTSGAAVVGDGGYVYVVAGWERLCVRYSVEIDRWDVLSPCRSVHAFAGACAAGGKLTVFGGLDERGASTCVEEYDIDRDEWRERTLEMPEPISYHHALVLYM